MDWFKLHARASCPFFRCFENNRYDRLKARRRGRSRLKQELQREDWAA